MTVLIVGAGASGMTAALAASENPACRVILLERQVRVGRKLLATGNGRCNLTNLAAAPADYHGEDASFCAPALRAFGPEAARAYFRSLGLLTVAEPSGRVYPLSDQANSVVDVLRFALQRPNVELRAGCEVRCVWRRRDGFLLKTTLGDAEGERLIVAAGGAAGEKLGGTRAGYDMLVSLGHTCTPLRPSLVQLAVAGGATRALKGVRADGTVEVVSAGRVLARSEGEIQFTESGLSGPAVFEISRAASSADGPVTLRLDLLRSVAEDELLALLRARREGFPALTAENLLTGILHNRLGRVLAQSAGLSLSAPLSSLGDGELARAAGTVKRFELAFDYALGFESAQVTAGGVRTAEFDPETMASRLVPGLYACGEVLDVDGDCGGFNLQWAWSSGRAAGRAAAREAAE
jgi:predicted Rossmann fold flavoprotein